MKLKEIIEKSYKKELIISDVLFERLKDYGVIKWHKNKNHSFYLKFKDVRLGSIRISNHNGRSRYRYTYEISVKDKDIESKIEDIVSSVIKKSESLYSFSPEKFIIFNTETRRYEEVNDLKEYKNNIWKK